ncbi:MAG TPA: glucans biosynthesis glucosyltransferase MdoH [Steroidobacteraceae bacterium]|nr:glucans biosynthesis glucosyltransferase MdoH [Steroidobacteraceae bacterium]
MDRALNPIAAPPDPHAAIGGMPGEAPLAMPEQDLERRPRRQGGPRIGQAVLFARIILVSATLAIGSYGVYQMLQVVRFASMTLLQGLMICFFAISLAWIAFAAGSVLAGASKRRERSVRPAGDAPPPSTALVMPIYNEDPRRTASALQAMAEALAAMGAQGGYEIVVLSDSTDADAWIRESLAINRLRAALAGILPVWYRHRSRNVARKAGNIEDFVKRWGGRYDYMIVLDADSLIEARTLVGMTQAMQADPRLGILQTAPQLIGAQTLFGRLQQFAACVYGPVITRGLAAWSGDSGNYWGHNAIIRVAAFAESCGLPRLPGRKPFGGHVLSHDFVEAALIRRRGWSVRMTTELGGSWEESPPSLIDLALRDRRWAQGNLQHMKVIGAHGLRFTNRLHLGIGIMSYLSSPLWLILLTIGFALALQSHLIRPEYFTRDFQLFPTWPRFDTELMTSLFWFSMVVLLVPKLIGFLRALSSRRIRRGAGGVIGVTASVFLEILLSALYAPVLMLVQCHHVFEIVLGRDSGWTAQRRDGGSNSWREAWNFHKTHFIVSCVTAAIVWLLSPPLLAWVSPALLGLFLSVPLSRFSGSVAAGRGLARIALLRTPEERQAPPLVVRRAQLHATAAELPADGLEFLAHNREARWAHIHGNLPRQADARGEPNALALTAERKLQDAHSLQEGLGWLTPLERVEVAGDARMLAQMALLPDVPRVWFPN